MLTLGICHDVLICSAALVEDGRVVAAIAEERLDRQKMSRDFPSLASAKCLEMHGIGWRDLDAVAIAWNPSIETETIPRGNLVRRHRAEHLTMVPARLQQLAKGDAVDEMVLTGAFDGAPPIHYVNHYDAHIGVSYLASGFEDSAILVLDGRAERATGLFAVGRGTEVEYLQEQRFPHSLGLLYGAVTQFLGFTPDSDEWKVMALASYGEPGGKIHKDLEKLITVERDGSFHLSLEHFEFYNSWDRRMFSDKFVETFGTPRKRNDDITDRDIEIAAAMQHVFEDTVSKVLTALHEQTGNDRVSVSGGCFMNSVFNGKITARSPFTDSHVSSCPDDSGTAIGAALWVDAQSRKAMPEVPRHNLWGPAFTDEECKATVDRYRIAAEVLDDPAEAAATDLEAGKLIGWFQGPMEFGQRALGGRSILVDPRREDGKDIVNSAVKYRESFRPFAPAILAEHVHEWFECEPGTEVTYMERVLQFRPDVQAKVPAVVHIDGSGRLQTVRADAGTRYRSLIEAFHAKTGVPIVLNTSFNLNGEPIVCTPDDALRTFFTCGLEVLYLGNVRVTKS